MFFFFKQKTAYEIRKGDWSSDVCSSDLSVSRGERCQDGVPAGVGAGDVRAVAALLQRQPAPLMRPED